MTNLNYNHVPLDHMIKTHQILLPKCLKYIKWNATLFFFIALITTFADLEITANSHFFGCTSTSNNLSKV